MRIYMHPLAVHPPPVVPFLSMTAHGCPPVVGARLPAQHIIGTPGQTSAALSPSPSAPTPLRLLRAVQSMGHPPIVQYAAKSLCAACARHRKALLPAASASLQPPNQQPAMPAHLQCLLLCTISEPLGTPYQCFCRCTPCCARCWA